MDIHESTFLALKSYFDKRGVEFPDDFTIRFPSYGKVPPNKAGRRGW